LAEHTPKQWGYPWRRCWKWASKLVWVINQILPAHLKIFFEILHNKTTGFLDVVHNVRLIHQIPVLEGHKLLKLVGQEFATNIEPML
jgi:hypothetical protein